MHILYLNNVAKQCTNTPLQVSKSHAGWSMSKLYHIGLLLHVYTLISYVLYVKNQFAK